jgi:glycosyltransferase involved in cell wall biosynthesis
MRILHLIHSEGIYGAECILLYLAREQQRRGHEPVIGSIRDPGTAETPFESLTRSRGLRLVPIRIPPRPTPGVVGSLLRSVRAVAPDVLHSHGYKPNILLGPLPRGVRGPMLATLHGWTAARAPSALWLYEQLDRLSLRRIDTVVAVTRTMLSLPVLRKIPPSRRQVIENGIPRLPERLADLAAAGVAPLPQELVEFVARRPTLVAIGRLSPEKGFQVLLEAFARAYSATGRRMQLLIVGEGSERRRLSQRIVELHLADGARLAGYVEGADRLLAHAAAFVMSSFTEGMPLVLLEALQWRVPIVATAVGAIAEILEDGRRGLLVPANDVATLSEALVCMSGAVRGSAKPCDDGDQAATQPYSSAQMTERYLDAYDAMRERSERSPAMT